VRLRRAEAKGEECPIQRMTLAALSVALIFAPMASAKKPGCKTRACFERVERAQWKRVALPYWATFERLARCESTGRWHLVNPPYSGGIQFTASSWRAVGGRGLAGHASKLEQIYRGVLLLRLQGWGAWPVCRHSVG
jgi:hypothetical protein